jgi:ribose 5-phosphate isomerase B
MESIAMGADHAGYPLKEKLVAYLQGKGIRVEDLGTFSQESVDYPDIAAKVVRAMEQNGHTRAILCCGSGVGVSISANRYPKVRAVMAHDLFIAKMSRLHNDSNVLCMGSRVVAADLAVEILETWLNTPFEGGRHERRVNMIDDLVQAEEKLSC